jgi:hypothetical protein
LYNLVGSGVGVIPVASGGTGLSTIPTNGQLLIGNGTGYTLNTLGVNAGISVTNGLGTITVANTGVLSNIAGSGISVSSSTGNVTVANTGVLSFSGSTTGLTPATATTGDVTLAGTLVIANGGTNGSAAATAGAVAYGTGTAYAFTAVGTIGQVLTSNGAGVPTWTTNASGDVSGPASSTDNAISRFDGTTGKLIQNSVVIIDDTGNMSGVGTLSVSGNTIISTTDNTNAALRITQTGLGNALLVEDSGNPDATPFVVTNTGEIVGGNTSALDGYAGVTTRQSSTFEAIGGNSAGTGLAIFGFATATASPRATVNFNKSQSTTIGTQTIVTSDEVLGGIHFNGSDGTNYIPAAQIYGVTDGTPGTNDMPGRLVFSTTADGASTPTERMRIDSAGIVQVEKTFRSVSTTITGASGGTITPTSATTNQYTITALGAAATIAIPSGTPIDGQKLTIRIKDNGTARALTWTTSAGGYRIIGTTLPTTTVISKTVYIQCIYNSADSFWDVIAVAEQA